MNQAQIIIAHPEINSLNFKLAKLIEEFLHNINYKSKIIDLYELYNQENQSVSPFGINKKILSSKDSDMQIKSQQNIIKNSKLTIVQFPMYWFSFPSVMHMYLEQMLTPGFAYPGKFEDSPLHDGRKVMLSITTQSTKQDYSNKGSNGDIKSIIHPMHTAFKFAGYEIIEPFIAYDVVNKPKEYINKIFNNLNTHLSENLRLN